MIIIKNVNGIYKCINTAQFTSRLLYGKLIKKQIRKYNEPLNKHFSGH